MATKKINFNKLKENTTNTIDNASNPLSMIGMVSNSETEKKLKTRFEEMDKNEIQLDPKGEFQALFPLNLDIVDELTERYNNAGFDKSQCIHLASFSDEPETGDIVIDGHHRLAAALKTENVEKIPVYRHKFQTRIEAKIYALELQLKRRNLDKKELFANFEKLKQLQTLINGDIPENKSSEPGKQAARDAKALGVSTRQVEKMNAIMNSGDEELIEKTRTGELTPGAAYSKLKGKNKTPDVKKEAKDDFEDIEVIEDKSGEPAAVTISDHSDGFERPTNKLTPEQDQAETALRKESYELGLADGKAKGFELAFIYVLSEMIKGKTAKEIYAEMPDLSPSAIRDFVLPEDAEDLVYGL